MKRLTLCLVIAITISGCTTQRLMTDREYQDRPTLESSLFRGDQDFVSEEAVQRILTSKITLPPRAKIAILKYESPSDERLAITYYGAYYSRSESYIKLQQELLDTVQSKLLASGRISEAAALPTMLVPRQPTISMLRQAAVRTQANLLLVYRTTSDVYYDYRLFKVDQVKAYSTVEAILMDVRTGIIPFTSVATKDILSDRLDKDVDREEAMKRVQKQASLLSLTTVSNDLAKFLKSVQ